MKRVIKRESQSVSSLETLLVEVDLLTVSEGAKDVFRRLLVRQAGVSIYFAKKTLVDPGRILIARKLLDDGLPLADIKRALKTRLGLTYDQCYRLTRMALDTRARDRQMGLFADTYGESDKHG